MTARALMFMGTGSDVGKSLIVAGLCRLLANRGVRVAPFKPQNMSNNAAVTDDGGEIGRAQALQARAAGIPPTVHMNPVLLKPQSETGAQVVVQGRMTGSARAKDFQAQKTALMPRVLESFAHMKRKADLVLVEGAGSAAEINLRANDIANMGFARAAHVPVVLIGDIDRGGVIASLVGVKAVLDAPDAALIQGFIVNKMRGDPALFADGMSAIARMTGWAPLGLVPYFADAARLPAEDALGIAGLASRARAPSPRLRGEGRGEGPVLAPHLEPAPHPNPLPVRTGRGDLNPTAVTRLKIAVPLLPCISNFDDLDPLRLEANVAIDFVKAGRVLPWDADVIVLPGSKATIDDLGALRSRGWDVDIKAHARRGGRVLGLCGGYQMLGRRISDPLGVEGPARSAEGLDLLDVQTELGGEKTLVNVEGALLPSGAPFKGYEMHVGKTEGPDTARPMLRFSDGRTDGASSPDGRVQGCYAHGLFADDRARRAWLAGLGAEPSAESYEASVDAALDALAAHLARHIEIDALLSFAR